MKTVFYDEERDEVIVGDDYDKESVTKDLFFYVVIEHNCKRGCNRFIRVFMQSKKDFDLVIIGEKDINTASYAGDKGEVVQIICSLFNYKTNGYYIKNKENKNVIVHEMNVHRRCPRKKRCIEIA